MKPSTAPTPSTWGPCPCCTSNTTSHAILNVTDPDSGESFRLRVPHARRHDSIGWGDRPRARWRGEDGTDLQGLEIARGDQGITATDGNGRLHRVPHGTYLIHAPKIQRGNVFPLAKAHIAPKAGQRWITVHPNGHDEKGVPVLIQENKDGTHRIIAGAGGKLTHLRLKGVKSVEEGKARAKDKAQERAGKERKRKADQTPGEAADEKVSKSEVKIHKRAAERKFVEAVRKKAGGVSEDLDESSLRGKGYSEGAVNLLHSRHHQKQLREAHEAVKALASKLTLDRAAEVAEATSIDRVMEESPIASEHARDMAETELEMRAVETAERKADRVESSSRTTSGDAKVGEKAAAAVEQIVAKVPNSAQRLKDLGGRDDEELTSLKVILRPAEEVERRAIQSLEDARILVAASKGEAPTDAVGQRVVGKALAATGIRPEDTERAQQILAKEAARQVRRYEVQRARAEKLQGIEDSKEEGGREAAERALAYSDLVTGIAKSASTAKKLGLTEAERTPLQAPEIAAITDVLADAQELRTKQRAFRAMVKAAESGDYDKSRRGFDLDIAPSSEEVTASIEEDVRRELTERLLGLASNRRAEHLQALASGHYDTLADVGLGIGGQRYVDRPVVDAIGVGNAALLLRHALESDGHDPKATLHALEEHHVGTLNQVTQGAIDKANQIVPHLSEHVEDVGDIETALARMDAHHADIEDAQRVVGAALGRMEATATLAQAFRKKIPEAMTIRTQGDIDTGLKWLHASGLRPGDYQVDGKSGEIRIPRASWDKLLHRLPGSEVEKRKAAVGIKAGQEDEKGWLPPGFSRRASTSFTAPTPSRPVFRAGLDYAAHSGDVRAALEAHIGSRIADGEHPSDIFSDLSSPLVTGAAPDRDAYRSALDELIPTRDADGKRVKFDALQEHFAGLEKRFMERAYGTTAAGLHGQDLHVDDPKTQEAIFRTLADHPETAAAFRPTGQLTPTEQRTLRDHFYRRQGIDPKALEDVHAYRGVMESIGPEPEKMTQGLFGKAVSPEWRAWSGKREAVWKQFPRTSQKEALAALGPEPAVGSKEHAAWTTKTESVRDAGSTPWEKFVAEHRSLELAQRALQDELRGRFAERFASHYGKLHGTSPVVGIQAVTNQERHLKALQTSEESTQAAEERRRLHAGLRDRTGGKFAAEGEGSVIAKEGNFLEQSTIDAQNQAGLFGAKAAPKERTLQPGERRTLGLRAENQIASLLPDVGAQFRPDRPIQLRGDLSMDGPRVHQQRILKMLDKTDVVGAWAGTGAGKTGMALGGFTQAHAKGKVKKGLILTPAGIVDQFDAEAQRFLEPGRYRWTSGSGMTHEQRVDALKSPRHDFAMIGHEAFRDTALKMMASHHGKDEATMKQEFLAAAPSERAKQLRQALDAHGIEPGYTYLDEAHKATSRDADNASLTHAVMQAMLHPSNSRVRLVGTATPHKNDEGEVYSMASMLDPEHYADRHQFMQAYGYDLAHRPDAIRRELDHLTYTTKIPPDGVDRIDTDNPRIEGGRKVAGDGALALHPEHQKLVDEVQAAYERARRARDVGNTDIDAVRTLSPRAFEGKPEADHGAIAQQLQRSLPIVRESAMRRAVNRAPAEINTKLRAMTTILHHDLKHGTWTDRKGETRQGKPSIVFTDSAQEARLIHQHLLNQGMRAGLYHGALSSQERDSVRLGYQPERGDPRYDVLVATSAAEAGLNLQRAKVVHHFDVPQTEKAHAQRSGRAYRQGQQGDVDIHNWHTDTEHEQSARRRLRRKSDLSAVFQTPVDNLDETGIAGAYHRALAHQHQGRETAA